MDFRRIYITHAVKNKKFPIIASHITALDYSESMKATHIYTLSGVFPAIETVEQIEQKLDELMNKPQGECDVSR